MRLLTNEGRYTKTHAAICADSSAKAKTDKKVTKKKRTTAKTGLEARKAATVPRKPVTRFPSRFVTRFPERAVVKYPERKVARFQKKVEEVEEDEEMRDNDDDPGGVRACLEAELAKDPRKPVAKFQSRFATRFPRNRVVNFPGKPAAQSLRKPATKFPESVVAKFPKYEKKKKAKKVAEVHLHQGLQRAVQGDL